MGLRVLLLLLDAQGVAVAQGVLLLQAHLLAVGDRVRAGDWEAVLQAVPPLLLGVGAEVAVVRREGVPVTLAVGHTVAEEQGVLLPVPGPREPVTAALGVPVREEEGQGVGVPCSEPEAQLVLVAEAVMQGLGECELEAVLEALGEGLALPVRWAVAVLCGEAEAVTV